MNVTHENFERLEAAVKAAEATFYIQTAWRTTVIDAKAYKRFAKANAVPLKRSKDGRGFCIARGRNWDYVTNLKVMEGEVR